MWITEVSLTVITECEYIFDDLEFIFGLQNTHAEGNNASQLVKYVRHDC
jgi:hypothetical protein